MPITDVRAFRRTLPVIAVFLRRRRLRLGRDVTDVGPGRNSARAARLHHRRHTSGQQGEWPFEGTFMIERFNSLQAVLDFWYSSGYQEAKKLREGLVDVDFLIAVEGVAP
jgi:hypothetical protein